MRASKTWAALVVAVALAAGPALAQSGGGGSAATGRVAPIGGKSSANMTNGMTTDTSHPSSGSLSPGCAGSGSATGAIGTPGGNCPPGSGQFNAGR